jgi:tetratricopeptide (TPR) repeat protein
VFLAQGRFPEALRSFQEARHLDERVEGVLFKIGICDLKLGNLSAAQAELREALAASPDDPEIKHALEEVNRRLAPNVP